MFYDNGDPFALDIFGYELDRIKGEKLKKRQQEIEEAVKKADWKSFFNMKVDSFDLGKNKLTFPVPIYAPDYEPSKEEEEEAREIEEEYKRNNLSYHEIELARWEYAEGIVDEEAVEKRRHFFHKYIEQSKFNFHVFYQEIYEALKVVDKDIGTNFSILFIESLMTYGTRGCELSDHPIIQVAMAGVKFLIDRERTLQFRCEQRNIGRSSSKICKSSLEELLSNDPALDEASKIHRIINGGN